MKRFFLVLFVIMNCIKLSAQSNPWTQVAELEEQALPKSALEIVNQIYSDAVKTGNSTEMIKALIYQLKFESEIDREVLSERITNIAQRAEVCKNPIEQAILYSLSAQLSSNYRFLFLDPNQYENAVLEWALASLRNAELLQQTPLADYTDLIIQNDSEQQPFPSLYDFLLKQGIESIKSLNNKEVQSRAGSLYQKWIDFRKQEMTKKSTYDNRFHLLMVQLEQLDFDRQQRNGYAKDSIYEQSLKDLQKTYKSDDFCVEILAKTAEYSQQHISAKAAYDIYKSGIEQYPDYQRIGILKSQLQALTHQRLSVQANNVVYPGKNLELNINYRNINRLKIDIYKINASVSIYEDTWSRNGKYIQSGVLVQTQWLDLKNDEPYIDSDTILSIPMNDLGVYEYVIAGDDWDENNSQLVNQQFTVSRLATVSRSIEGQREFLVVDRMSGKPIAGAQIHFYQRTKNARKLEKSASITTDKQGLAQGGNDKNIVFYNASFGNDTALITSSVPWISTFSSNDRNEQRLFLFTDRSIYRPGQTVYFKGIAVELSAKNTQTIKNVNYTLTFRDANGQEIANKKLKTNDFGSFSGEFTIPQEASLNGNFYIQSDIHSSYITIQVEEYKRPTFDIQFADNEQTYKFEDTVIVSGNVKTFSGIHLPFTNVQYTIRQQWHWLNRFYHPNSEIIASGNVQTDADGQFEISFIPKTNGFIPATYTYVIETTVTNSNGETQNAQTQIHIGDKSMYLRINDLAQVVDKNNSPKIQIQAFNLSGIPISISGEYEIYDLKTTVKFLSQNDLEDEKQWQQNRQIRKGKFTTDAAFELSDLRSLPSGRYRIIVKSADLQGREVIEKQDFTLTSDDDKSPPISVYQWLRTPKTTCAVGEKAQIIFGSSAKEVSVLYEIFQNDKRISLSRFELSNTNKKIEIPFLETYGEGITAVFTFVKDGQFFTESIPIYRKQEDKSLKLNMEVFRDRLSPGQTEEWRISIKDAQNQIVATEVLAAMYDASLDKIRLHTWNFNPVYSINLHSIANQTGNEFNSSYSSGEKMFETLQTPNLPSLDFNWFGLEFYPKFITIPGRGIQPKVRASGAIMLENNSMRSDEVIGSAKLADHQVAVVEAPPVQIRQNFAETAFFYPQLKTNDKGETQIVFTLPESNTSWKFKALAHTQDVKFGQIKHDVISQKQLMITPNLPRFMREGDKMTLSTNISNLSDETIKGTIAIQCFNPETNETNIFIADSIQSFEAAAGKTTTASWIFDIPENQSFTAVKIIAKSANFSDGEQHLIPILPRRMLVTETLPIVVPAKSNRSFDVAEWLKKDSPTATSQRLTWEITAHPAWYAVQALPTLSTPQSDNVLDWFAAYYSNEMAVRIAHSTPKIKTLIELWKQEKSETLQSNLEKNKDLKMLLLEETPWLMEAHNESEQKQQLALLFDENRSRNLNRQALEKIQSLQAADGGWTWFKGMNGNVGITQWILYGLKTIDSQEWIGMKQAAISFIDRQFKHHYDDLKKQKDTNITALSTYELEYLYVRSMYKEFPLEESKEAVEFYTTALEKSAIKDKNLYHKALSGVVLKRKGNEKAAQAILKSLREYATHKPDLGMFWANNQMHCFMTQSAICVHTFIMQAFNEIGTTTQEQDEMRLWLLNQKRTQLWESVPATVNAIDVLLNSGSDWLATGNQLKVSWGKEVEEISSEPGTGLLKGAKDLSVSNPKTLTIEQPANSPAYGALYHQYFEDLDKINATTSGLYIEKALFIEKINGKGKTWLPIEENRPLQVGDKVAVRLLIYADRDMEFVALKDMRSACFEPVDAISGTQWHNGLIYYQSPKDASNNFFFNALPKGKHILEYAVYVNAAGEYSSGIATIQCLYAPEFKAHTSGKKIIVDYKP